MLLCLSLAFLSFYGFPLNKNKIQIYKFIMLKVKLKAKGVIMENCLFCKIIKGEIPSTKIYEDEDMLIIKDIAPQAEIHYLLLLSDRLLSLQYDLEHLR